MEPAWMIAIRLLFIWTNVVCSRIRMASFPFLHPQAWLKFNSGPEEWHMFLT